MAKKPCFYSFVFLLLTLVGCQPISRDKPSDAPFVIEQDTVILDKSHILSIKTALYQPSFDLQGVLLPRTQSHIQAPKASIVSQVFVKKNQAVKKGDLLFVLIPATMETPIPPAEDEPAENEPRKSSSESPKLTKDDGGAEQSNTLSDVKPSQIADTPPKIIPIPNTKPIIVTAPHDGLINAVYLKEDRFVDKDETLLSLYDHRVFELVSTLPRHYEKYLQIGQSVNFHLSATQVNESNSTKQETQGFSGQVARIIPAKNNQLSVTVQIISTGKNELKKGEQATGHITYGDLTQGAVVPDFAIADGTSFKHLEKPPHKPATPIPAKIWVIRQDERLALSDVDIIEYLPDSNRYLVSGISNDSLLSSANLPVSADGMLVKVR